MQTLTRYCRRFADARQ